MDFLMNRALLALLGGAFVALAFPLARWRTPPRALRGALPLLSNGILLFLALDLFGHALELPLEVAAAHEGPGLSSTAILLDVLFLGGLALGFYALSVAWHRRSLGEPAPSGGEELALDRALGLSTLVAAGIGLYGFVQGLSFGEAGRFTVPSAISEGDGTPLLIAGLALHNAAKGLAIITPLIGRRPSWRALGRLGLIAALPPVAGALVGSLLWAPFPFVGLMALASGTLFALVFRALAPARGSGSWPRTVAGLVGGFVLGALTTLVLEISHYSLPELMSSYRL